MIPNRGKFLKKIFRVNVINDFFFFCSSDTDLVERIALDLDQIDLNEAVAKVKEQIDSNVSFSNSRKKCATLGHFRKFMN